MYTGILGKSIKRNNRVPFPHSSSRTPQYKLANQRSRPIMDSDQLLLTIERLSQKFGTPFKIDGHREQFVKYLKVNQPLREKFLDHQEKTNHSHISLPQAKDKAPNFMVSWWHIF